MDNTIRLKPFVIEKYHRTGKTHISDKESQKHSGKPIKARVLFRNGTNSFIKCVHRGTTQIVPNCYLDKYYESY
jgi:hypothetical protein